MANPIIKIKRGSTTPVSLSAGELAIDLTNKNLFVGKADGSVLAIGGEGTFATKAYADGIVSTANSTLTQAIADETSARQSAVTTLTDRIANVESNVDPAALDSLTEVVSAFQAADSNLNGAITSLASSASSALAAETAAREAADGNLSADLGDEVSRATAAEADLSERITYEENARVAADAQNNENINLEVSRATAAEATLTSDLAAEVAARIADVDAEETRALAAESALSDRVTALETTIDGGVY